MRCLGEDNSRYHFMGLIEPIESGFTKQRTVNTKLSTIVPVILLAT